MTLKQFFTRVKNVFHNKTLYRGKFLGSSLTDTQKEAIQSGTFEDLWLGDYWEINGIKWRIADFDYWYNCGDIHFTKHHLVIMPDKPLYDSQMNETNTTTGGYIGSKMYRENLSEARRLITSAFGSAVLTHREYLTNTVTDGYPSTGTWYDSNIELPNEIMMYGSYIFTPAGNGSTIVNRYTGSKKQLALSAIAPQYVNIQAAYWLRDIVSSSHFALVNHAGDTYYHAASSTYGVRPVFPIG